MSTHTQNPLILVTGATGYIGGRLVPQLLTLGYRVRCLVRDPSRLQDRNWYNNVDIATGDVLKPDTLTVAMADVDTAYYLIHSMAGGKDFHQRDLAAANNFSAVAKTGGVKRIIYLGGLAETASKGLSEHLHSRQQTGEALRAGGGTTNTPLVRRVPTGYGQRFPVPGRRIGLTASYSW